MNVSKTATSAYSYGPFGDGPSLAINLCPASTSPYDPVVDGLEPSSGGDHLMFADGAVGANLRPAGSWPQAGPETKTVTGAAVDSARAGTPDTSKERLDKILKETGFGSREQLEELRDFRDDVAKEAWEQGNYALWLQSRIAANMFGSVVDAGGFPGLIVGSVRVRGSAAARREAMRLEGIPVSQQPHTQWSPRGPGHTPAGRELIYETPQGQKHVQHQLADRNHDPHWEAGKPKRDLQTDPAGRLRLRNDKSKVDEFAPDLVERRSSDAK